MDGEEDAVESPPGGAGVLMLAVPNLGFSNNNRESTDMQEAALLLNKLMTPLRQYNITPLSFVSLQLEKVFYPFVFCILLPLSDCCTVPTSRHSE